MMRKRKRSKLYGHSLVVQYLAGMNKHWLLFPASEKENMIEREDYHKVKQFVTELDKVILEFLQKNNSVMCAQEISKINEHRLNQNINIYLDNIWCWLMNRPEIFGVKYKEAVELCEK